jgi:hypothetical protein
MLLRQLADTIEILSPPKTVWRVLSDPTFIPKLYNDAVTIEVDPPGPVRVGQSAKVLARVANVKVVVMVKFTKVESEAYLESKVVPGGLFDAFDHTVALRVLGWGTEAKITFAYSVAPLYATKVPDMAQLEKALSVNFRTYAQNLKDISELIPLPE